ncbi:UNVERIFIED_ORG: altronate dehydratase small subunit [Heyndrickxia coagulans]
MQENYKVLMLNPNDDVAVALQAIPSGATVTVSCKGFLKRVQIKEDIMFGHKFAVHQIKKGEDILKYGEIIGEANRNIEEGEHVHVHNLDGKRGRGDKIGTN